MIDGYSTLQNSTPSLSHACMFRKQDGSRAEQFGLFGLDLCRHGRPSLVADGADAPKSVYCTVKVVAPLPEAPFEFATPRP